MRGRSRLGGPRFALVAVLAVALSGGTGCRRDAELGVPPGAHVVNMVVLKGRGGETLALVPVYIHGKGPFAFALDTGASRTVVDRRIAAELGLQVAGPDVPVSGVGGNVSAQPVHVENWRVDEIELPPSTLDTIDLSDGDRQTGLQGLLGSDTLSRFQVIQVDYKNQRLVFHPGPSGKVGERQ